MRGFYTALLVAALSLVACKPRYCDTEADCSPDLHCDTSANHCVECVGDGDCVVDDEGGRCLAEHRCGCTENAHCSSDACDLSDNRCLECDDNSDCPLDSYCGLFNTCESTTE